jgi:hypothetical protein
MSWKCLRALTLLFLICILTIGLERPSTARGGVNIFASPIQAGCYLAQHDVCKIHVDPFTLNLATGEKLVSFQLMTTRIGSGSQRIVYDFHPDQSNPVPFTGNTYTPSLVAKDFAATCSQQYTLSLQGQDTADTGPLNLGATEQFTCPTGTYFINLPMIKK